MRTLFLVIPLALGLAGCPGDDGSDDVSDTDETDAVETDTDETDVTEETDPPGETDETDEPPGLVGSEDHLNPTAIAPGEEGSGTVATNHFWSITSQDGGTYDLTLTSDVKMGVNNCETTPNASGCICVLDGEVPYCCDTSEGEGSCTLAVTVPAGETHVVVVYPFGASGDYTLAVSQD